MCLITSLSVSWELLKNLRLVTLQPSGNDTLII